jgi:hypothetical protein
MDTRFLSPPEIPRILASPTRAPPPHVAKIKYSGEDIDNLFDILLPSLTIRSCMGGMSLCRKSNSFLDGQGRKMDVVVGGALNVTAIMSNDFLWSRRVILNITLDVVVGITLVCEQIEGCCASRFWASQHN